MLYANRRMKHIKILIQLFISLISLFWFTTIIYAQSTTTIRGTGLQPLVEESGSSQTLNIYGPGGVIIAQVATDSPAGGTPTTQTRYLLHDHLGSTRVVLDSNNQVLGSFDYSPFGETTPTGNVANVAYRYTGQEVNGALGTYNYHARQYDAGVGRFLRVDPARQFASSYAYVGNNPANFVDPSGLCIFCGQDSCIGGGCFWEENDQLIDKQTVHKFLSEVYLNGFFGGTAGEQARLKLEDNVRYVNGRAKAVLERLRTPEVTGLFGNFGNSLRRQLNIALTSGPLPLEDDYLAVSAEYNKARAGLTEASNLLTTSPENRPLRTRLFDSDRALQRRAAVFAAGVERLGAKKARLRERYDQEVYDHIVRTDTGARLQRDGTRLLEQIRFTPDEERQLRQRNIDPERLTDHVILDRIFTVSKSAIRQGTVARLGPVE